MNEYFDPSEHFEEDPQEAERQAQWEEEAHYWHTVTAYVDLLEQYGLDKVKADVSYIMDRREADKTTRSQLLDNFIGLPFPDLSFLSIRKFGD